VLTPTWLAGAVARSLARACARRAAVAVPASALRGRIVVDDRYVGDGYGHATAAGDEAMRLAHRHAGFDLDPTYTAKAFARALALRGDPLEGTVLYWHTLSSAPLEHLLVAAPAEGALAPSVRRLLERGRRRGRSAHVSVSKMQ
jgi:hypothetical protein